MKQKPIFSGIFAGIGMLILILDSKTALSGAAAGVELAVNTVIPALFPFFFLTNLLANTFTGSDLTPLRPLGRIFHVPKGAEAILLCGFLGGYPAGAQAISAAYTSGTLPEKDARQMLAFCNNAGPSFLFGMAASLFPGLGYAWGLWGIHIVSAAAAAQFFPCRTREIRSSPVSRNISPSSALRASVSAMGIVCGWVVLFRVITAFLDRWVFWLFQESGQAAIVGFLELSNGCCVLDQVRDLRIRFLLCSAMLAFGGVCVAMQTASVIGNLPIRTYLLGKGLQTAVSICLCCLFLYGMWLPAAVILLIISILAAKKQKSSSIPETLGV